MYTNVDSLSNKANELRKIVGNMDKAPDIIAITEVKPKNCRFQLQPTDFKIEGYTCFSANLDSSTGRGIIVWILEDLNASIYNLDTSFSESVWLEISPEDHKNRLLFGCIYRSPNSSLENSEALNNLLRQTDQLGFPNIVITGDFNFPDINWAEHNACTPAANEFLKSCDDAFLTQHVSKPTRGRINQRPNILDLVLTSDENMVTDIKFLSPIGSSDHACLKFEVFCGTGTKSKPREIFLYNKADFTAINQYLSSINWDVELSNTNSTQEMYKTILNYYNIACHANIPKRQIGLGNKKTAPGVTSQVKKVIQKKHRAWTRYMETRTAEKYREYTKIRNKVKRVVKNSVKEHEKHLAQNVKSNPKCFWGYVKKRTQLKEKIPNLLKDDDQLTTSDKEKAMALNKFFASVFTEEPPDEILPQQTPHHFDYELTSISFDEGSIMKKLKELKPGKSAGPDQIHARVLKETAASMAKPLCILFKRSFESGELPEEFTTANITAIHKKGEKTRPTNYRPISLTSIPCKILEFFIRQEIVTHINRNNLFSDTQYGFRSNRSTVLQLLAVMDQWTRAIEDGHHIDTCYIDVMKAFDSVPHRRLLLKLHNFGIRGPMLKWIKAFLTSRQQKVVVNGEHSDSRHVGSGVPQGSVLGPVLFILYVNDMPSQVSSNLFLYADDAKLFRPIKCPQDEEILQNDINKLQAWSTNWLLKFHPEKCKMMQIGKRRPEESKRTYTMTSQDKITPLTWSDCEKDLGVLVDSHLTFEEEIGSRVKKANSMVAVIRRTFTHLDIDNFPLLFKAIVRPHLEYAAPVWYPRLKKHTTKLEAVQRRATKQVPSIRDLPYEERLRKLKLPSIAFRHFRGDLIETYKIITKKYDLKSETFFETRNNDNRTRGHHLKIIKPHARSSQRKNFFSIRVINCWNSLPEQVINAPSLNSFKNRLDKFWANHPLLYNWQWDAHVA